MRLLWLAAILAALAAQRESQASGPYALARIIPHPYPGRTNGISSILFTSDYMVVRAPSNYLYGDPSQLFVYDVTGEHLLHTYDDPTPGVLGMDFGIIEAGDRLFRMEPTAPDVNRIVFSDLETGEFQFSIYNPLPGHRYFPGQLTISGDYAIAALTGYAESFPSKKVWPTSIFVFDTHTGLLLHTLQKPTDVGTWWGEKVAVSGNTIAVATAGSPNASAVLFDAATGQRIGLVNDNPLYGRFTDFIELHDHRLLISEFRGTAYLLDTNGVILQTIPFPEQEPTWGEYLQFAGENILIGSLGDLYAGATATPHAWLYDGSTGALIQRFDDAGPGDRYTGMTSDPSGRYIAMIHQPGGEIWLYSIVPEPASITVIFTAIAVCVIRRVTHPRGLKSSSAVSRRLI